LSFSLEFLQLTNENEGTSLEPVCTLQSSKDHQQEMNAKRFAKSSSLLKNKTTPFKKNQENFDLALRIHSSECKLRNDL